MTRWLPPVIGLLISSSAFGQGDGLQPGDRVRIIPRDSAHPLALLVQRDLEVDARGHLQAEDLGVDCDVQGLEAEDAQTLLHATLAAKAGLEVAALSTRDGRLLGEQQAVVLGGQVRRTGPVPFHPEMTLAEAVRASGGATEFGAVNRIKLIRDGRLFVYDLRNPAHAAIRLTRYDLIEVPMRQWLGQ